MCGVVSCVVLCGVWCVVWRGLFNMRAFCRYTRKRFEPTHRDVLNLHTERREGSGVLFIRSLSLSRLSRLLSSVTMTLITRPVGSLCVHAALTCQSVRMHGPWPIPCWPNMFASCKKQLSWYNCASLVPLGMKWACICAGNGCCVWWYLVVFGCFSIC